MALDRTEPSLVTPTPSPEEIELIAEQESIINTAQKRFDEIYLSTEHRDEKEIAFLDNRIEAAKQCIGEIRQCTDTVIVDHARPVCYFL